MSLISRIEQLEKRAAPGNVAEIVINENPEDKPVIGFEVLTSSEGLLDKVLRLPDESEADLRERALQIGHDAARKNGSGFITLFAMVEP
ncbi:hypothetical protein MTBBW1_2730006 [Desulfamplus magnetovallimortis]|uniref:Uncharacterized protein n=1 Tax=Desulfamplus magnetovallimortis TaxID=1246637 RepID=A0A1W1HFC9_9BACT|nr:hypothetical protein [Desulfamplus magnetovallimortis]SLM31136.1 hypothetical protein MTBBW1_2730006 [Desulfamplus magnetovallimortis]